MFVNDFVFSIKLKTLAKKKKKKLSNTPQNIKLFCP